MYYLISYTGDTGPLPGPVPHAKIHLITYICTQSFNLTSSILNHHSSLIDARKYFFIILISPIVSAFVLS